jgi:hypothetical protein
MAIETYRVDIVFEVLIRDYDPARFARVAAQFAAALPPGAQTLSARAGAEDGKAGVSAKVPEASPLQALRAVVRALDRAALNEPMGLDSLGPMLEAHIARQLD